MISKAIYSEYIRAKEVKEAEDVFTISMTGS